MIAGRIPSAVGGRGAWLAGAVGALLLAIGASFALNFPRSDRPDRRSGEHHPAHDPRAQSKASLPSLKASPASSWLLPPSIRWRVRTSSPTPMNCSGIGSSARKTKTMVCCCSSLRTSGAFASKWVTGLRNTLTDALSKVIITNAITPRFKAGDFGGGISRGVDDIITVLTTDAQEWEQRPSLRLDRQQQNDPTSWILFFAFIAFIVLMVVSPTFRWLFINALVSASAGSGRSAAVIRAAATLAAGAFREGVAFPAAVVLPVAAALRGAGDGDFERGPAAYYQSDPRRGGKVLWRDRLRARANLDAGGSIADFYRCRHCARAALAAHRVYLDDRCPHSLAAGDHRSWCW